LPAPPPEWRQNEMRASCEFPFRHSAGRTARELPRDPLIDSLFQDIERKGAVVDERVVEASQVEPLAKRSSRFRAKRLDPELPELVAERLSRLDDVAVDLRRGERAGDSRMTAQVGDRLLAVPAQRVNARIDDQAAGAHHLPRQLAEFGIR